MDVETYMSLNELEDFLKRITQIQSKNETQLFMIYPLMKKNLLTHYRIEKNLYII
jgi:hypothetical protein